jgi:hypothetical protein
MPPKPPATTGQPESAVGAHPSTMPHASSRGATTPRPAPVASAPRHARQTRTTSPTQTPYHQTRGVRKPHHVSAVPVPMSPPTRHRRLGRRGPPPILLLAQIRGKTASDRRGA